MSKKNPFYDKRLLLVRHGQADGNVHGAFLGRKDDPLTEKGREQAQHLITLMEGEELHSVHTSPLQRAFQTATPVAKAFGLEPIVHQGLVEQDYGDWDGLVFGEARKTFPQDFDNWRRDANQHPPTNGETLVAVTERVHAAYREIEPGVPDGATFVMVGHGGSFQALLCALFGIPTRAMWPFRLQNGTITEIQIIDGLPSMTRMSEG